MSQSGSFVWDWKGPLTELSSKDWKPADNSRVKSIRSNFSDTACFIAVSFNVFRKCYQLLYQCHAEAIQLFADDGSFILF